MTKKMLEYVLSKSVGLQLCEKGPNQGHYLRTKLQFCRTSVAPLSTRRIPIKNTKTSENRLFNPYLS